MATRSKVYSACINLPSTRQVPGFVRPHPNRPRGSGCARKAGSMPGGPAPGAVAARGASAAAAPVRPPRCPATAGSRGRPRPRHDDQIDASRPGVTVKGFRDRAIEQGGRRRHGGCRGDALPTATVSRWAGACSLPGISLQRVSYRNRALIGRRERDLHGYHVEYGTGPARCSARGQCLFGTGRTVERDEKGTVHHSTLSDGLRITRVHAAVASATPGLHPQPRKGQPHSHPA